VQDLEILVEDSHRIHARNRRRDTQNTHRIRKCLGGSERPRGRRWTRALSESLGNLRCSLVA
jgi:hypothetical protein